MLNASPALNFQYSSEFKQNIESLLMGNLIKGKSPALSIDFLVAIYLFSDYVPVSLMPNYSALLLPVIYERIWMLYLAYYRKRG